MNAAGLSAFLPTPVTDDGALLHSHFETIVERVIGPDIHSISVLGSIGIAPYLSRPARREVVETAVAAAGSTPVVAGVGALRTDDACRLAEDAARAGASMLLLTPVSYLPLASDEVYAHFHAVARVTDIPICIYSNPATTGFTFSESLLARLAELPTVCAAKLPLPTESSIADELATLRGSTDLVVGYSGDWGCAEALLQGADCWHSVVAGLFPRVAGALTAAARAGNRQEAERLNDIFAPLWSLFRKHGSIRVIYAAAALLGQYDAHPPPPLRRLDRVYWPKLWSAIAPLS